MVEKGASWVLFRLWGWGLWIGENVMMKTWSIKLLICLIPTNADTHKWNQIHLVLNAEPGSGAAGTEELH